MTGCLREGKVGIPLRDFSGIDCFGRTGFVSLLDINMENEF